MQQPATGAAPAIRADLATTIVDPRAYADGTRIDDAFRAIRAEAPFAVAQPHRLTVGSPHRPYLIAYPAPSGYWTPWACPAPCAAMPLSPMARRC